MTAPPVSKTHAPRSRGRGTGTGRRHPGDSRTRRRGRDRRGSGGGVARARHGDDFAIEPCSRSAGPDWYFAAGTTVEGSEQYLVLFNPFGDDAIVDVSFLTDTGVQEPDGLQALVVPRRSRITIPVQDSVLAPAPRRHPRARPRPVASSPSARRSSTAPRPTPVRCVKGFAVSLGATVAASAVWRTRRRDDREQRHRVGRRSPTSARADARVEVHVVLVGGQTLAAAARHRAGWRR